MNTSTIEKYFSGETSVEEELQILNYFSSENIDPELAPYQNYFNGLAELKKDSKFIITEENYEDWTDPSQNHYYIKRWGIAMAVAASVALLLLFFPSWHKNKNFVIINGEKYTDKKRIELAFQASLENVKLDVKQMFNDFDFDL
jgi:hypothetical protein